MDGESSTIGRRIASLREARGLTQAELANALGVDHKQVVSALEKGGRALKAAELVRLSEVFHISPAVLLGLQDTPPEPFVLWRQPVEERIRREEEALLRERCRRYAFVERLAGITPARLPLRFDLQPGRTSFEAVAQWAESARKALGLGDMPAHGLPEVLENRHGIKIFVTPSAAGSGAAFRSDDGDAVQVNAGEPRGRRAFSIAHEVFHLLTWEDRPGGRAAPPPPPSERVEQLAENFAAALVLPSDVLLPQLPSGKPADWPMVQWTALARQFGVTVPALAWRLVNLRKLTRDQARAIIADPTRVQSGAQANPADDRPLPDRYVTLAFRAYITGDISAARLAELLETSVGMLRKVLADYGFDPDSDAWEAKAVPA